MAGQLSLLVLLELIVAASLAAVGKKGMHSTDDVLGLGLVKSNACVCTNTCSLAYDGTCDDTGVGGSGFGCAAGSDCHDCGPSTRTMQDGDVKGLQCAQLHALRGQSVNGKHHPAQAVLHRTTALPVRTTTAPMKLSATTAALHPAVSTTISLASASTTLAPAPHFIAFIYYA